jgi:hypothetical protein
MALNKQVILKSNFNDDVVFNDAYIKVENVNGNKTSMRFEVYTYKEKEGFVVDRKSYAFTPKLEGRNFIAQAYEHLKTLLEFEGAIDC